MKPKILVVDDEPGYCDLLQRVAQREGYRVTATCDSRQAAARLQEGAVELLITDLDMPGRSGFDLIELARTLPLPPEILVITAQKGLLDDGRQRLRPYHCLLKPFSLSDLRAKLELLAGTWRSFRPYTSSRHPSEGPPAERSL